MIGGLGTIAYSIISKDETGPGLDSAGARAQKIGKIAGVAMTGIGGAMTLMTDSAKKTNATIGVTAMQLGVTAEEMRELTLATTNVTFPIEEVTTTFDLLTRAGMEDKDMIAEVATTFDTLGDATGYSASQITQIMIPAFNAFDIPLQNASDHVDIFTHLTRNTTIEMQDFSNMVKYLAPDLDTMDISLQESVAVMEALADKGIQGSSATREFRTAVSQADGDINAFYEALGLTAEEVETYTKKLEDSKGMTQEYADVANTQYGAVDNLKQAISELTLKYGSMLEPLDALGPAMTTLGPIMITFSTANWSVIPALSAHATAAWTMISPYLAIIAPIAAVIAIFYVLEKKFGVVTKVVEVVKEAFTKLVDWLKDVFTARIEFAKVVIGLFAEKFAEMKEWIAETIESITIIMSTVWDIITAPFTKIIGWFRDLSKAFKRAGRGMIQSLIDGIKELINKPVELIRGALSRIRDMLPFSPAKVGPLSKLPNWDSYLVEPLRRTQELNPNIAPLETGAKGGVSPNISEISANVTATIYNYSDVEDLGRKIGEATVKGIYGAYDVR